MPEHSNCPALTNTIGDFINTFIEQLEAQAAFPLTQDLRNVVLAAAAGMLYEFQRRGVHLYRQHAPEDNRRFQNKMFEEARLITVGFAEIPIPDPRNKGLAAAAAEVVRRTVDDKRPSLLVISDEGWGVADPTQEELQQAVEASNRGQSVIELARSERSLGSALEEWKPPASSKAN